MIIFQHFGHKLNRKCIHKSISNFYLYFIYSFHPKSLNWRNHLNNKIWGTKSSFKKKLMTIFCKLLFRNKIIFPLPKEEDYYPPKHPPRNTIHRTDGTQGWSISLKTRWDGNTVVTIHDRRRGSLHVCSRGGVGHGVCYLDGHNAAYSCLLGVVES